MSIICRGRIKTILTARILVLYGTLIKLEKYFLFSCFRLRFFLLFDCLVLPFDLEGLVKLLDIIVDLDFDFPFFLLRKHCDSAGEAPSIFIISCFWWWRDSLAFD